MARNYDYQSAALSSMINSLIGIPYQQAPQYKNNSSNITKLSEDEWLKVPISPERKLKESHIAFDFTEDKGYGHIHPLLDHMPDKDDATYAFSLELIPMRYSSSKLIYRKLCPNPLFCSSLNIMVQDFVLGKPELLKSIIEIAEHPCDYIRNIGKIRDDEKHVVFYNSFESRGRVLRTMEYDADRIKNIIEGLNKRLGCNRNRFFNFPSLFHPSITRKYVLLTVNANGIYSSDKRGDLDIVIKRKDIN